MRGEVTLDRIGIGSGDDLRVRFFGELLCTDGARVDLVVRVDELLGHITKGFHDMVSIHHGGIWQPVSLIGSGALHAIPDGVAVFGDPRFQEIIRRMNLPSKRPQG